MAYPSPSRKLDALRSASACGSRALRPAPQPESIVRLQQGICRAQPVVGRSSPSARPARSRRPRSCRLRRPRDGEMADAEIAGARSEDSSRWRARSASCCCPRTPPTKRTSSSKCAPARAATRRRCSPAICCACTSAMPTSRAGRSDHGREPRRDGRLQGSRSPTSPARACTRG